MNDRSIRAATFAFVLSRSLVLAIFILATHLSLGESSFGGEVHEPLISLHNLNLGQILRKTAQTADANWYMEIATLGYKEGPFAADRQQTWAFFPLFPMLLRLCTAVTGEVVLTGIALSNLLLFIGLVLLHKASAAFGLDGPAADRAVFYLAIFPTSYFFSMPQTESLFLVLTVGSLYAAKRDSWWVAGTLGALASATRVNGILLLPALAILYWQRVRRWGWEKNIASLCLVPVGLLTFLAYLYQLTGNALAFTDVQASWGRTTGFFLRPLAAFALDPLAVGGPWNFTALNFFAAVVALICGGILIVKREWALATYTFIQIILPLSSLTLQSATRYVMTIFPVFIVLAMAGRRPTVDQVIRTIFIALLSLMAALFAARFSIAMT